MEERLFRDLTSTEFKIYVFIKHWRGDNKFKKGLTPTTQWIYEKLNVSRRTITRAVKGLKDKGVLNE